MRDNTKVKNVAIYCRVAQASEHGIDCQREYLMRHAMSLGYSSLACYEDNGVNGLTLDRPGFRRMESDIQAGKISIVMVKDISRIGRDILQTLGWIGAITANGIKLISVNDLGTLPALPEWKSLCGEHA